MQGPVPRRKSRGCVPVLVLIVCLLPGGHAGGHAFDPVEVDAIVKHSLSCHGENPGLAVSVVKDGKVIFSKGYGVTNLTSKLPVTKDTVFGIASLSKGFAATLLLKLLHERTNLTADSKLHELLGSSFRMRDPTRAAEMTFADLLSHRTAVTPNNLVRFDNNFTRDNILERIGLFPAPDQFRVKYYYNNLMYGAVTSLTEKVGGAKWEELVDRELYKPLGMDKSGFATLMNFSRPDVATAYEVDLYNSSKFMVVSPEFSRRWAELGGSGAVMSTADDMAKWMNLHLSDGQGIVDPDVMSDVHKGRFLVTSSKSRDTRTPQFPVTASENVYAGGFKRGFYRGYERLSHTGSTLGYRSMMSLLPDQKIGVFIVMSGPDDSYAHRVALQFYLLDAALGDAPWINASSICTYPLPWGVPRKSYSPSSMDVNIKPRRDLSEYAGVYYNGAYGTITVYVEDMHLHVTYGWAKWRLVTLPGRGDTGSDITGSDTFYGQGLGITNIFDVSSVTFNPNPANLSIVSVTPTSFNPHLPPVFERSPDVYQIVG